MMPRILFLIFMFCSALCRVNAQTWETGVFGGVSGYMGDINPKDFYRFSDPAYGFQLKRNFDGYWSAKLSVVQTNILASDAKSDNIQQQNRNLQFYSPLTEGSLQVEFNFFNYLAGVSRIRITPYLFTGVGAVKFNPKVKQNGIVYELNDYQTEGQAKPYQTIALSIPYGVGVKYNIKGNWNLIGELGYRTAFTDYLDDVSTNYRTPLPPGKSIYDPSGLAIGSTQRGDYRKRDTYMFAGLSLTFTFVSRKCPVVGN